jgi:hypothetical protein
VAEYDMALITGVFIAGAWHNVDPGTLLIEESAVFHDAAGGTAAPGGTWFGFNETLLVGDGTQVTTRYVGRLENLGAGRLAYPAQPVPPP